MHPAPRKPDITNRLLSTFKQLISEGTLAPGTRLPAERQMATNLNVSRGSLRQALKMLEVMGVVSQRVGDGTYLNSAAPSILAEPMKFLMLLDGITFEELIEARLIVEPELAARAAERATPASIAALRESLRRMRDETAPRSAIIEEDLYFHRTIFEMADNRVCTLMFSIVHEMLHNLMAITSQMVGLEHTLKLHTRIYHAIRKQDSAEARARMSAHLIDAGCLLRRSQQQSERRVRLSKFKPIHK
ncbi:MAG TPA: FadR/GntR family transcriptional regulator [Candidatus Limnocylindrales bacterium]|nr:FadR/GntR family transcriptional regulator [Candidatus Limnocylindrales bacterium]